MITLWFLAPSILLVILLFANRVINSGIPFLLILTISTIIAPLYYVYLVNKGICDGYKYKLLLFIIPVIFNGLNLLFLYLSGLYNSDIGFIFSKIVIISNFIILFGNVIVYFLHK